MISRDFFTELERRMRVGNEGTNVSFGNVDIILCSVFCQFLPVASEQSVALYHNKHERDPVAARMGRDRYESF